MCVCVCACVRACVHARVCVGLVCLLLFSVRGEQHSSEGDEGYGKRRERMSEVTSFTEVSVESKILPGGANMAQLIVAGFVGLTNEVSHRQNERVTWDCDIVTLKVRETWLDPLTPDIAVTAPGHTLFRADRCPVLSQKEKGVGGFAFWSTKDGVTTLSLSLSHVQWSWKL